MTPDAFNIVVTSLSLFCSSSPNCLLKNTLSISFSFTFFKIISGSSSNPELSIIDKGTLSSFRLSLKHFKFSIRKSNLTLASLCFSSCFWEYKNTALTSVEFSKAALNAGLSSVHRSFLNQIILFIS
jgi:hypothetical protein